MNAEEQDLTPEQRKSKEGEGPLWEAASQAAIQVIRNRSGQGQLAIDEEILEELVLLDLLGDEPGDASVTLAEILSAASQGNDDLTTIPNQEGKNCYYSTQFMTNTYAQLLVRREGDPLQLVAEIVRENSALYPRPFPLGAFERSPFSMTWEEIQQCLEQMTCLHVYQDIAQTTTSAGNVFLYSTLHLDTDYAATLAEWIDVGQHDNP
jgi:hypothetical protein